MTTYSVPLRDMRFVLHELCKAGENLTGLRGYEEVSPDVMDAVLEECAIPVFEYKPAQVKIVLTGYGKADKEQIARMLAAQIKLPDGKLDNHAMDAIAIAVCHARSRQFSRAYAR